MSLSAVFNWLAVLLCLAWWVLLIIKFVRNKHAPVKRVKAVVVDKFKPQTVSNMHGTFKKEGYVVVFLAGKERLAFEVSEFSFRHYKLREKGTLTYRGNRLIDFK